MLFVVHAKYFGFSYQTWLYSMLRKEWNVIIYFQTECMNPLNKNEMGKLVCAALWNELKGWKGTSQTTDHLLLSTGQTAYCTQVCVAIGAVAQLTGVLVFYLKNYTFLYPQRKNISVCDILRPNLLFVLRLELHNEEHLNFSVHLWL